jgi:hypothetical protein
MTLMTWGASLGLVVAGWGSKLLETHLFQVSPLESLMVQRK